MIIRKFEFLKLKDELPIVDFDVYKDTRIGIVYVEDKGYVLFKSFNDEWDDIFFIKTETLPGQYLVNNLNQDLLNNKGEFIGIIEVILNGIYDDEIKEYEKKHPEFVFLRLFNNLVGNGDDEIKFITPNDKFYKLIDDGFIRLELSFFKNGV